MKKNKKNAEAAWTERQFKKAVILITILLVGAFFGLVSQVEGSEIQPEPKPSQYATNKLEVGKLWAVAFGADLDKNWKDTVTAFKKDWSWNDGGRFTWRLKNELEDIKQYQRHSWKEGKDQLQRNKQQISNLFEKLGITKKSADADQN